MRICILDGYVDEPSCLGVPPFISPYPRYIYGMLKTFKLESYYITIDQLRSNQKLMKKIEEFDLLIVIAGTIVPGKYLTAKPLSLKEIRFLPEKPEKIIVGPVVLELQKEFEGFRMLKFPFEKELHEYLSKILKSSTSFSLDKFSVLGAEVVKKHPDFPHIICEIETYRGCYWRKCSFCMERIHGKPVMRDPKWVLREIEALYTQGVRYFRIGRQTDFLTYMADFSKEIPKPNVDFMISFHREIWRRCPKIRTLHLDNINPRTIAEYPRESKKIIKTIVIYQTPGNVAAMGLESADESIIEKNNLAATPDDVIFSIKLINEYGRSPGYNGLPCFLPGINFVAGLRGETKNTYEKNFEFLEEILEKEMLLRRINIRQVKILKGTPLENYRVKKKMKHFRAFKKKVREKIDREMLKKIAPVGRKITDVRCEVQKGKITFGRQLATYPLLIGIVGNCEKDEFIEVRVVGHGERSITAVEHPLNLNKADLHQLECIPGIGRKTAIRITVERPFKSLNDLKGILKPELTRFFTLDL